MSVCLTPGSCQQKINAGKIQRNIKTYNTFLVQALINHIMVSVLPPDCPTLPDGRALTAALVGMDKDRFNSMFLDGIQVRCESGSSCNVHAGADSVEKSSHCDYNDTTISLAMATATRVAGDKECDGDGGKSDGIDEKGCGRKRRWRQRGRWRRRKRGRRVTERAMARAARVMATPTKRAMVAAMIL